MRRGLASLAALAVGTAAMAGAPAASSSLLLSDDEIAAVIRHGPWPVAKAPDPSNRASGSTDAIAFGRQLFFDTRLSATGSVSCATCHRPDLGWTDGLARARGIETIDRNTQSLFNVARQRWYGRDGRTDSLWAHSLGPILDPREMGASADHVARLIATDPIYSDAYRRVFGLKMDPSNAESVLVDVAKALAAFQETIVSGRTSFDAFRDALARGDHAAAGRFPQEAQRGAALFVGRGKCSVCHFGPAFTNGEFADAGVPYFVEPGRVDPGRQGGIARLRQNPFNQLGRYNDDPERTDAWATRHVADLHANFGAFKVPTLRNLVRTAPYMHDGSKATLTDVVRHYSEIDLERLHSDGERILEPLNLSDREIADLVAFLRTLSE